MGEHTPGPWQVHGSHVYSADPERAILAQVHNPGSRPADFPLTANARLIAAAPELLSAIEASLQFVIAWRFEYADKPNDDHNNAQRDRIDAVIEQTRAAIAATES